MDCRSARLPFKQIATLLVHLFTFTLTPFRLSAAKLRHSVFTFNPFGTFCYSVPICKLSFKPFTLFWLRFLTIISYKIKINNQIMDGCNSFGNSKLEIRMPTDTDKKFLLRTVAPWKTTNQIKDFNDFKNEFTNCESQTLIKFWNFGKFIDKGI